MVWPNLMNEVASHSLTVSVFLRRSLLKSASFTLPKDMIKCACNGECQQKNIFAVAASDESITNQESEEVRQIARELGLEHQDYIAARQNFLHQLEALQ